MRYNDARIVLLEYVIRLLLCSLESEGFEESSKLISCILNRICESLVWSSSYVDSLAGFEFPDCC